MSKVVINHRLTATLVSGPVPRNDRASHREHAALGSFSITDAVRTRSFDAEAGLHMPRHSPSSPPRGNARANREHF